MKAKAPNLTEKLAATLLALRRLDPSTGELVPLVDREWAKARSPEEIVRLFEFDHKPVPRKLGGSNHPTNLIPRIKAEHREITAKVDQPMLAKVDRLSDAQREFQRRMLAKVTGEDEPTARPKAKLRSRGFQGHRRFNGEIVRK